MFAQMSWGIFVAQCDRKWIAMVSSRDELPRCRCGRPDHWMLRTAGPYVLSTEEEKRENRDPIR